MKKKLKSNDEKNDTQTAALEVQMHITLRDIIY